MEGPARSPEPKGLADTGAVALHAHFSEHSWLSLLRLQSSFSLRLLKPYTKSLKRKLKSSKILHPWGKGTLHSLVSICLVPPYTVMRFYGNGRQSLFFSEHI